MVRWIVLIIVLLVIAGSIYAGMTTRQAVEAAAARRAPISSYVEERAKTRLPRTYRITMPIDGRILPIELDEGDPVTAGQAVAKIEPADLETTVAQAEARVQRLRVYLRSLSPRTTTHHEQGGSL